jgi:hypothetical protein
MARRIITVTIDRKGRDFGKGFRIEEMPATQAERWLIKAFLNGAKSGAEIPEGLLAGGNGDMEIVAFLLKFLSGIMPYEADILLSEMMDCVTIIPDPKKPQVYRNLIEDDTEEVLTLLQLKKEVFRLHTGHFTPAVE